MKSINKYILVFIACLMSMTTFGQLDVSITSTFTPGNIEPGETAILELNFSNLSIQPPFNIPVNGVTIQVQVPTEFYDITGAPVGVGADLFNWSDLGNGIWFGVNNTEIPIAGGGPIEFEVVGILVTDEMALNTTITAQIVPPSSDVDLSNNTSQSGLVVPVELTKFDVFAKDCDKATVSWQTASETNNHGFYIERSIDKGDNFQEVGFVKGSANSSSIVDYFFENDISGVGSDLLYYRLKQEDLDGRFEFFNIELLRLDCGSTIEFSAYPNPVLKDLNIDISNGEYKVSQVVLRNDLDQVLTSLNISDGNFEFSIDMTLYPAGVYFISILNGNNSVVKTKKIIKLSN